MPASILMMLNAPYPDDIRVTKEATALVAAGCEVHLLCLRRRGQPAEDKHLGIQIHRIDAGKNNYQLAFWDAVMSSTKVHPLFLRRATSLIQQYGLQYLHVHDLPLAGTALSLRKNHSVRVVVDFHENYPEALRAWFTWKKNLLVRIKNRLFMHPDRWTQFEKRACLESDKMIAVVEEMKERLITAYGISPEKIVVVTNTESSDFIHQTLDENIYGELKGKFILTYSGGIGPHRGVDVAIRGMKYLEEYPDIQFAIVGFGSSAVMNNLYALTESLKLKNVHFLGYQPFPKFYSYMRGASVNVIPHQSNPHTDNTIPHKLFQGMMAARPLLVSSCAPLRRLVAECNSGLVFPAGDSKAFAEQVLRLYNDQALAHQLGENGRRESLEGPWKWEVTQKELLQLYGAA